MRRRSYFGRDLLSDIVVFAKANANVESIKGYNVKTAEDINALDRETRERVINAAGEYKFDSEFIINFLSALIATARYPEKPDIVSNILNYGTSNVKPKKHITKAIHKLKGLDDRAAKRFEEKQILTT